MTKEELLSKFENLTIWSNGSSRAPHKPLLVLLVLGYLQHGDQRYIPYKTIDVQLKQLLKEFGPYSSSYRPEYPFWRLQNDSVWEIPNADKLIVNRSGDVKKSDLVTHKILGGFKENVFQKLKKNPDLVSEITSMLLDAHFPPTLHDEILSSVGLSIGEFNHRSTKRDPNFSEKVLSAYEYKCAVCSFDIRIHNSTVGIEAAHIQWHKAHGPDTVENGIALCNLHHILFDSGIFTLDDEHRFLLSEKATGTNGFSSSLLQYHSQKLNRPIRNSYEPDHKYIDWHHKEVFKHPAREIV